MLLQFDSILSRTKNKNSINYTHTNTSTSSTRRRQRQKSCPPQYTKQLKSYRVWRALKSTAPLNAESKFRKKKKTSNNDKKSNTSELKLKKTPQQAIIGTLSSSANGRVNV